MTGIWGHGHVEFDPDSTCSNYLGRFHTQMWDVPGAGVPDYRGIVFTPAGAQQSYVELTFTPTGLRLSNRMAGDGTLLPSNVGSYAIHIEIEKETPDNGPIFTVDGQYTGQLPHEGQIQGNAQMFQRDPDTGWTDFIPGGFGDGYGYTPTQGEIAHSTWSPYVVHYGLDDFTINVNVGDWGNRWYINAQDQPDTDRAPYQYPALPPPTGWVSLWEVWPKYNPIVIPPPPPCDLSSPWPYVDPGIGASPGPTGVIRATRWK